MQELKKQITNLQSEFEAAWQEAGLAEKAEKLSSLTKQLEDPDIWKDNLQAQDFSKQQAKLSAAVQPWVDLRSQISDLRELAELDDESLKGDIEVQFKHVFEKYTEL